MDDGAQELGRLIAAARARVGWSQAGLCRSIRLSGPFLSGVEKGRRVPRLPVLARLFSKLAAAGDRRSREDELAHWLASWVVAAASSPTSETLADLDPELTDLLSASADRLHAAVRRTIPGRARPARSLAALRDFGPFIAICADRREPEPRSIADLFILSGAISDLTWLPRAPEGVISAVRTDKSVVQTPPEALADEFGRHSLLIIAGPNANWAARLLNPSALWRTRVEPGWEEWDQRLRLTTELNQGSVVAAFSAVVAAARFGANRQRLEFDEDALARRRDLGAGALRRARELAESLLRGPDGALHTSREIVGKFQTGGLVDPIEGVVHDVAPYADVTFATVSIAPHPWARQEGLVSVVVAGTRGPGTTEALRVLLEEPHEFEHRPFGGVMEMRLPSLDSWGGRFLPPTWSWVTSPYGPSDLEGRIENVDARRLVQRLADSGSPKHFQ